MNRNPADTGTKPFIQALTIAALLLLRVGTVLAGGAEKEAELNLTLHQLTEAARQVAARAATAAAVLAQLQDRSEALEAEIQEERRRIRAVTLRQALGVRRIDYNLQLMQQAASYAAQIESRLAYLRAAETRLNAYREQVRDDRLMLRTLDTFDCSLLLSQARETIEELHRECTAPLLTAGKGDGIPNLETLWNDIVQGR